MTAGAEAYWIPSFEYFFDKRRGDRPHYISKDLEWCRGAFSDAVLLLLFFTRQSFRVPTGTMMTGTIEVTDLLLPLRSQLIHGHLPYGHT